MSLQFEFNLKSDTKSYDRLIKTLTEAANVWVDIGYFQNKTKAVSKKSNKGKKVTESFLTPAQKAAINEFGDTEKRIPARPHLRNTLAKNDRFVPFMAKAVGLMLSKGKSINLAMVLLGEKGFKEIVKEIDQGQFKPNSDFTIAKKGSSKPLIDSGEMRINATYRLNTED